MNLSRVEQLVARPGGLVGKQTGSDVGDNVGSIRGSLLSKDSDHAARRRRQPGCAWQPRCGRRFNEEAANDDATAATDDIMKQALS